MGIWGVRAIPPFVHQRSIWYSSVTKIMGYVGEIYTHLPIEEVREMCRLYEVYDLLVITEIYGVYRVQVLYALVGITDMFGIDFVTKIKGIAG